VDLGYTGGKQKIMTAGWIKVIKDENKDGGAGVSVTDAHFKRLCPAFSWHVRRINS
jgi:hypothetical protein